MAVSHKYSLRVCDLVNSRLLAKPAKVFPLFSRSKAPVTTQPPLEDTTSTYPSSQPIDFVRSDETFLQAVEASKPPPKKLQIKKWKSAPSNSGKPSGFSV